MNFLTNCPPLSPKAQPALLVSDGI